MTGARFAHASTWELTPAGAWRYWPGVESAPLGLAVPARDPHVLGHACPTCHAEPGAYCTRSHAQRGGAWSCRRREALAGVDTRPGATRPDAGAYRVRMADLGTWDGAHGLPVAHAGDAVYREAYAVGRAHRAALQAVSS